MSNSLQDQLLKAGLVDEKSAKRAHKEKQKLRRQQKGRPAAAAPNAAGKQKAREQAARDTALNREREAASKAREVDAQVDQIITSHRVALEQGEAVYNFLDGGKVRRLHLAEAQHRRLVQGRVGLVRGGAGYELVSAEAAEKIGARAPERLLVLNRGEKEAPDPDDPYAGYEVPDDLTW
jgi:uncharacterized protein YaiL (DUF2058 family)